jgi:hypothetical protein
MELPEHALPQHNAAYHGPLPPNTVRHAPSPLEPATSADSNWAACLKTRCSTTGVNVNIAGGAVGYKTKLQPTVAGSSTEVEFMAAYDAAKMVLFLRSIMYKLGIPQQAASMIYEDNDGATAMANAQKPQIFCTCRMGRTRQRVNTAINTADHFTKILDRTLFYRHVDFILGHIPPCMEP